MSFVAEVTAKLGLDTTEFQRKLTQTKADIGEVGKDIDRKLNRGFGGGDAFKGLLQGAGIASVEKVVEKISDHWKNAAEQAERIAESTAKTLGIYESIFESRRTDQQNLDANLKEQARLRRELADAQTEKKETRAKYSLTMTGVKRVGTEEIVTKEADPEKAAELSGQLAELAKKEFAYRDAIKKKTEEAGAAASKATAEHEKALAEIADMEEENYRKTISDEGRLNELEKDRARFVMTTGNTIEEEDARLKKIAEIDGKILDMEKAIKEEKEKQTKAAKEHAQELERANDALAKARSNFAETKRDRSSLTLEEVAKGEHGTTQTQKARARTIQRLEKDARRQRATGFNVEADASTDKALLLRDSMQQLLKADRTPMADAAQAIKDSEKHLAEINTKLTPTGIGAAK